MDGTSNGRHQWPRSGLKRGVSVALVGFGSTLEKFLLSSARPGPSGVLGGVLFALSVYCAALDSSQRLSRRGAGSCRYEGGRCHHARTCVLGGPPALPRDLLSPDPASLGEGPALVPRSVPRAGYLGEKDSGISRALAYQ